MIFFKTLLIFDFLTFQYCSNANHVKADVNRHKNVQRKMNENFIKRWEYENDDNLEYPRGDKHKLNIISTMWSEHHDCLSRVAARVTTSGRLPGVYVAALVGAVARLPCGLCVAPDERSKAIWVYSHSSASNFVPLSLKRHMTTEPSGNITIYRVSEVDSGVYKCTVGHSSGGPVFLKVVDPKEGYDVVKSISTYGPYPSPPLYIDHGNLYLKVFTLWSPWSECSTCDQVGRRRRHGMCYVQLVKNKMQAKTEYKQEPQKIYNHLEKTHKLIIHRNTLRLFEDFPGGIPCRSRRLPPQLREPPSIGQRRNEIMIGLCKVKCDSPSVFELRSIHGTLLERANNSAGVYSLWQQPPMPVPYPLTQTLFALRGVKLNIICPGISIRDIPFTWRVGTKVLSPRAIDRQSAGRVHLNAEDHLVFTEITYSDANLYSCWQRDILVGTVKLVVWEGAQARWNHHVLLLTILLVAAFVLRLADRALRNKRRRLGML